jgi:hypothetical protein
MKVFFDTEFTGLHRNTTLISIGMVDEKGRTFYGECNDFDPLQIDSWLEDNVISNLVFFGKVKDSWNNYLTIAAGNPSPKTEVYGDHNFIAHCVSDWLVSMNEEVEMWSDCLAWNWVLFCDLWSHAFNIPENVYYIPFDICTVFKMRGIDPDTNREKFAEITDGSKKHNALWDANVIRLCYEQLCSPINPYHHFHLSR